MITAYDIEQKLGLHNVELEVSDGKTTIRALEPVTEEMQAQVQTWYDAGTVDIKVTHVRNAQLRQWLIERGLDDAVEAKLADSSKWPSIKDWKIAKSRFEYEPMVNRNDPLVEALGHDLGMDDAAMDAAFVEISLIP
jgi:hypothetical protein